MRNHEISFAKALEDFMDRIYELYDIPSIAIGVSVKGKRFSGTRGYKNYITKEKLCKQDVFHCTSLSKLLISAGIMRLIEDEKIDLNDKLVDILPYLSIADKRCEDIRLFNLMSHTSGLPDVDAYHWDTPITGKRALKEYVLSDEIRNLSLLASPKDNRFIYSNIGYDILGLIIEEVSGICFEDFIKDSVFMPLGMNDSGFYTPERTGGSLAIKDIENAGLAMPHGKSADKSIIIEENYPYTRQHSPSSTLTSTVEDMLKFAVSSCEKNFLEKNSYDSMWHDRSLVPDTGESVGLGWFKRNRGGFELMGHEGSDDGFRSSLWICPAENISAVILSNITNAPLKSISNKLFDLLMQYDCYTKV